MKPVKTLLIILLCSIASSEMANAQCAPAYMRSTSFDTAVTGTGNNNYNFTTPQFSPQTGTLVAVVIKTKVSIGFGYHAENADNSARPVNIGAGRYDYLSSPALYNSAFASGVQKNYGPYSLAASDGVANSGPDYLSVAPFSFLNNEIVLNDSIITSTENFLGYGTIGFGYYPSTYSVIPQNLDFNFSANDTVHFSVTYYYCNSQTLPITAINFLAKKENDQSIQLSWQNKNEEKDRIYEVEKSSDGKNFSFVKSVPANVSGNYLDQYEIAADDKLKIYFRLKIKNSDGSFDYSDIRLVDLKTDEAANALYLYPNPCTDFLTISFNESSAKNLAVDIYAAHGSLVQHDELAATNAATIKFKSKFARGIYFLRITDMHSMKMQTKSFLVE